MPSSKVKELRKIRSKQLIRKNRRVGKMMVMLKGLNHSRLKNLPERILERVLMKMKKMLKLKLNSLKKKS